MVSLFSQCFGRPAPAPLGARPALRRGPPSAVQRVSRGTALLPSPAARTVCPSLQVPSRASASTCVYGRSASSVAAATKTSAGQLHSRRQQQQEQQQQQQPTSHATVQRITSRQQVGQLSSCSALGARVAELGVSSSSSSSSSLAVDRFTQQVIDRGEAWWRETLEVPGEPEADDPKASSQCRVQRFIACVRRAVAEASAAAGAVAAAGDAAPDSLVMRWWLDWADAIKANYYSKAGFTNHGFTNTITYLRLYRSAAYVQEKLLAAGSRRMAWLYMLQETGPDKWEHQPRKLLAAFSPSFPGELSQALDCLEMYASYLYGAALEVPDLELKLTICSELLGLDRDKLQGVQIRYLLACSIETFLPRFAFIKKMEADDDERRAAGGGDGGASSDTPTSRSGESLLRIIGHSFNQDILKRYGWTVEQFDKEWVESGAWRSAPEVTSYRCWQECLRQCDINDGVDVWTSPQDQERTAAVREAGRIMILAQGSGVFNNDGDLEIIRQQQLAAKGIQPEHVEAALAFWRRVARVAASEVSKVNRSSPTRLPDTLRSNFVANVATLLTWRSATWVEFNVLDVDRPRSQDRRTQVFRVNPDMFAEQPRRLQELLGYVDEAAALDVLTRRLPVGWQLDLSQGGGQSKKLQLLKHQTLQLASSRLWTGATERQTFMEALRKNPELLFKNTNETLSQRLRFFSHTGVELPTEVQEAPWLLLNGARGHPGARGQFFEEASFVRLHVEPWFKWARQQQAEQAAGRTAAGTAGTAAVGGKAGRLLRSSKASSCWRVCPSINGFKDATTWYKDACQKGKSLML